MTTTRLNSILRRPPPQFAKSGLRDGSINQAVRDAFMLDTSAGQFTLLAASASAFGVPVDSLQRRVQPDYSPFDEIEGYEFWIDEFERSTSPEETAMIKFMIDENMDLRKNLEDYGGWRFVTGFLDPVNVIPVPFAIGKGFARGAGAALKRGIPIVAGTELVRHNIDPTSTFEETLFATAGGSLFMGLMGGAVGKIPKTSINVTDALNRLIPPKGTTSMFAGVPWHAGTTKGVFQRMTNALRSAVSNGEPSWKKVDPDDMELRRVDEGLDGSDVPGEIIEIHHKDAGKVLSDVIRGVDGKTLEIFDLQVPREHQRNGIGSFALRQAIQFAEDNGMRVQSALDVTADGVHMWKGFEEQGFNIVENKNFEVDSFGNRESTDGVPLFTMKQIIDPDVKTIDLDTRQALQDIDDALKGVRQEISVLRKAEKVAREKVKNAKKAGGALTKARAELRAVLDALDGKNGIMWQERILVSKQMDQNVAVANMLDEATIKDWDLLPTGYNTILGKLNEFPWWGLMKTPLRAIAPDLAVRYQMFALKIASTPGLNNRGNTLSSTTGPSVESLIIEYTGKWLVATRRSQVIYRKYVGMGESSGQVKQFAIDQAQRVRSRTSTILGGEEIKTTTDGKLTIAEFDDQVSHAIARGGSHEVAEVAEAATAYVKVLKDIGDEGKLQGVFATQQNIARRIAKIDEELLKQKQKWFGEPVPTPFQAAAALARELGVKDPEAYVDLTNRVQRAEKDGKLKATDPVTGKDFTAKQLMKQLEKEGLDSMGPEFSRRRGYTREEIADWNEWYRQTTEGMAAGQDTADVPGSPLAQVTEQIDELRARISDSTKRLDDIETQRKEFEDAGVERIDDNLSLAEKFKGTEKGDRFQAKAIEDFREKLAGMDELFDELEGFIKEMAELTARRDELQKANVDLERQRTDDFATIGALLDGTVTATKGIPGKYTPETLPPGIRNGLDSLELEKLELQDLAQGYKDTNNSKFIHRMWIADAVVQNEVELKALLTRDFEANPKNIIKDRDGNVIPEHPDVIRGRVNETYASILREAETGGIVNPKSGDQRVWLNARKDEIEAGTFRDQDGAVSARTAKTMLDIIDRKLERIEAGGAMMGGGGPLIARRLDLDDQELMNMGVIESNVNTWMNHYVQRTAPIIETARIFGDGKAQAHIDELVGDVYDRALSEPDPKKAAILFEQAEEGRMHMEDLRDIVHGTWQIPSDPHAITPRILRMLRNFNILGAMGRSVLMAMGDMGNVVISQGLIRSLGHGIEHFASGISDGKIKMMRDEVDLAGSVSEVILGMRYHQMTDFGAAIGSSTKHPRLSRMERSLANASQRFFLWNLLGPWTDMARRFSGGMLQSRLIENSLLWRAGNLSDDEIMIMGRLGISREQAIQFADEWEFSGKLKHKAMWIANTTEWTSENAVRVFRAAMNTEINRMVPTPGAVDKPKSLLKSEWWKVIGQYRGFSMAATHRIMGAGLQTKGAQKYSGAAAMVGIAMIVDSVKRPDYIQMPLEQQVLRAVELSAITGIFLDLNDTLERASGGTIGIRPMIGMQTRERNPNWSNRMGTIGAVPNQWLTLMYAMTSDEAETDDLARAIRYMIPYNNLIWWNEAFNRAQRSAVDLIEDTGP